ncbi:SGNH/GDSL hydrolase family protein [Maribacter sp. 2307ULW6-5]|uniref:SGNH/GDSL hydrolase family protein n=1 Tax=Maribacter sp. 2307ULW6-5 TaxID=3386275 RepID=UPI0039BC2698
MLQENLIKGRATCSQRNVVTNCDAQLGQAKKGTAAICALAATLLLCLFCNTLGAQSVPSARSYLDPLKVQLKEEWPRNKTVNLVFHGHSVPAGYFKTPLVNSLEAYPHLVLEKVKEMYPTAVVNTIVTAIGGEHSQKGAKRFKTEVLTHAPDVLFIDYALNDRNIGLERAKAAWELMIKEALAQDVKVILLTPTPDLKEDILLEDAPLERHSGQVRELAARFGVGLVDSYGLFREIAKAEDLKRYMAQGNHVNGKGHAVVSEAIAHFFIGKLNRE